MATRRTTRTPARATKPKKPAPVPAARPTPPPSPPPPSTGPSGARPKRFLSPEQLFAGVAEIVAIAAQERVPVVLVGGLAMQHYGSDRLTGDLDFAAADVLRSLPVIRPLTFGGVQTTTPGGVPVDLIVRDDDYQSLYEEIVSISPMVPELGVRVVPPTHLAATKMAAGRDKDTLDLKFLLAEDGLVDLQRARAVIRRHLGPYAAQEFDRVVDEVAWEKHRGRRE